MDSGQRPQPTLSEFFTLFCRIGLTSFGGGVSGWLYREIVQKKNWIEEGEFFDAFALCQALPGINVTNMAVWMGYRLLGTKGAIAGVAAIILPPSVVAVMMGILFSSLTRFSLTHVVLTGAAAAAIGLPFSMGLNMAWRIPRRIFPAIIAGATCFAISIMKAPLLWVLLIAGSISVLAAHYKAERS
jgi:chromate transporter